MNRVIERRAKFARRVEHSPAVDQQAPQDRQQCGEQGQPLDRREDLGCRLVGEMPDRRSDDQRQEDGQEERFRERPGADRHPLDQQRGHQWHQHHRADRHQRYEGSREAHVAAGFCHHLLEERRAGRQAGEEHHDHVGLRQRKNLVIR